MGKGLSILNDNDHDKLSNEKLVSMLLDYYPEAVHRLTPDATMMSAYDAVHGGGKTPGYLLWDHAEQQCENAAQSARDYWDADWRRRHREQSRRGGLVKSYTWEMYLSTAHMTNVSEIARVLGIARGTVYAMKREFADLNLSTGKIHEETSQPEPAVTDRDGAEAGTPSRLAGQPMVCDDAHRGNRTSASPDHAQRLREDFVRMGPDDCEELALPY
ncbi:hypothetical protein [Microbacterium sp. LWS13-1.2]|uniref:Helix-turn-helix domain of resolvase n=1 Tax=Microbacterium sp. LWS13-1.2 TaxID=3135264 RepID=A0AAU6S7G5_9MICO